VIGAAGPVPPPRRPSTLQRLIGTIRRECLDFMIPLNERHVRSVFGSGSLTTIAAARTPAWGPAFPTRLTTASHHFPAAIRFVMVIEWWRSRFSADCTTSIVSSRWPHEANF
jgi:hypothetical protein